MTPDLIGILDSLDSHGVRFVVIGGLAATLRAGDRFTFDTGLGPLDILGQPDGSGGYEALRRTARRFSVRGVPVWVGALDDLIAMKRAAGRQKDRP